MAVSTDVYNIMKDLYTVSGLRISLHDSNFNEIAAYPEDISGYCAFLRQNPKAEQHCIFTDRDAFEKACHSGRVYIYKCRFGLYEAACPIYHSGVISGYLMMGQALGEKEGDFAQVIIKALPYVSDRQELEKRLRELPTLSAEKMLAFSDIMTICAEHLTAASAVSLPRPRDLAASVLAYIERNLGRKLTVYGICAEFNCSKSTLMKVFKSEYGTTVNDYIISKRMSKARGLLTYTEYPISEISDRCGFSDQGYFSKTFAKENGGVSPTSYRYMTAEKNRR